MFVKERKSEKGRKKNEVHEPTGLQKTLKYIFTLKNIFFFQKAETKLHPLIEQE